MDLPRSLWLTAIIDAFLLGDFDLWVQLQNDRYSGRPGLHPNEKLPDILSRKRRLAKRYGEKLGGLKWLKRPTESAGTPFLPGLCLFYTDSTVL